MPFAIRKATKVEYHLYNDDDDDAALKFLGKYGRTIGRKAELTIVNQGNAGVTVPKGSYIIKEEGLFYPLSMETFIKIYDVPS